MDVQQRGVWLEAAETVEFLTRLVAQGGAWKVDHLRTYQHGKNGKQLPVKIPKRAALTKVGVKHRFHDTKANFTTAVAQVAPARGDATPCPTQE